MDQPQVSLSRRALLQAGAALAAGASLSAPARAADFPRSRPPARSRKARKKIAVVTTAYHYLSHAYHICGRFLDGYLHNGKFHFPDYAIAGMYVEQQKANDLSKEIASKHGIPLFADIGKALTRGGDKLAVDGVLLIGEHGDYPYNAKGQKLYPRYEMFQKIVAVFRKSGHGVPVFCDKHLYYDRKKARAMYDTARKLRFPLYAGSSLPITWRRPELELPLGVEIKEALVASRGEIEIYGIHALEALQCMIERRFRRQGAPGEGEAPAEPKQGVKAVTCLQGDAVWKAGDKGLWSWELLEHALGRTPSLNVGDIRDNCRQFTPPRGRPTFPKGPVAFLIEYRDGLKAAVLNINGHIDDTVFAAGLAGKKKPESTLFYLPPPPGAGFLQALTTKIEDFLATGKTPYPVERTLLTGGILDAVLESRVKGQKRLETPDLDVRYAPPRDSGFMRGDYCAPVH